MVRRIRRRRMRRRRRRRRRRSRRVKGKGGLVGFGVFVMRTKRVKTGIALRLLLLIHLSMVTASIYGALSGRAMCCVGGKTCDVCR